MLAATEADAVGDSEVIPKPEGDRRNLATSEACSPHGWG